MPTCGACGKEITECPECGGKVCEPGCPDRLEDGCTCELNDATEKEK
jgi:hypothetical protein